MAFAPCPSCRRHVRVDEGACPFCGATLASLVATPEPSTRMNRARLFAFATTVTVTAATIACPSGRGSVAPVYGAPVGPDPATVDAASSEQPETAAIAPPGTPATIAPPPSGTVAQPSPTIPATAPTPKPKYPSPGPPVALYGMPPAPND